MYIAVKDKKIENFKTKSNFSFVGFPSSCKNFTSENKHFVKNAFSKSQNLNFFSKWRNYVNELYFQKHVNSILDFAKFIHMWLYYNLRKIFVNKQMTRKVQFLEFTSLLVHKIEKIFDLGHLSSNFR